VAEIVHVNINAANSLSAIRLLLAWVIEVMSASSPYKPSTFKQSFPYPGPHQLLVNKDISGAGIAECVEVAGYRITCTLCATCIA